MKEINCKLSNMEVYTAECKITAFSKQKTEEQNSFYHELFITRPMKNYFTKEAGTVWPRCSFLHVQHVQMFGDIMKPVSV